MVEVMAVRDAFGHLRRRQRRVSQIAEMRAVGMGFEEIASKLSISSRTVERDLKAAREWLEREFGPSRGLRTSQRRLPRRRKTVPLIAADPGHGSQSTVAPEPILAGVA
jgi:hypothetical protein